MAGIVDYGCPVTKTLTVSFTASNPVPSGGYNIQYRPVGNSTWIDAGNFSSSPATINNVPACTDVDIVIQSVCPNSQVSTEVTTTATTSTTAITCGSGTQNYSHTHVGLYRYPEILLDCGNATGDVTINWDTQSYPNQFYVYDDTSSTPIAALSWRGQSSWGGPWGNTGLSMATTGTITFTRDPAKRFYKLVVESYMGLSNPVQDTFSISMTCPTVSASVAPVISQNSCSLGVADYRIDAPANTVLKVALYASGSIQYNGTSGTCAYISGTLTSSTGGAAVTGQSNNISGSSPALATLAPIYQTVTVPSSGYVVMSTTLMANNASETPITGTLKVVEVNGTAYDQAAATYAGVCKYNTTSTTCASTTYYSYDVTEASASTGTAACLLSGLTMVLYAAEPTANTVTKFYTSTTLSSGTAFSGDTNYYRFQRTGQSGSYRGTIALSGAVGDVAGC